MLNKVFWATRALVYWLFLGRIGVKCYIGKPICVIGFKKIFIGTRVRIFPNVRLEAHGETGSISIEDNVAIAQNVQITSGSELVIGKSTTILANVFITNIDHEYKVINKHILDQEYLIKETRIGENCYIGIGACIQAGTVLGRQCIVGSNSVVRGTFPDYSVIVGSPGRIVKRYNFETREWEKTSRDGSFI